MLKQEENEVLSRVSAGTPMGELLRRFWLPALLSSEVVPDSAPVRLKILHEDLVAFRDTGGNVGIVRAYCSHRLAPLYFGRNEHGGLRCPYHGWKFDVGGKCLETPNVPPGAPDIRRSVGISAYPTQEASGVVWIYMGPAEALPPFPKLECTTMPLEQVHNSRWLQRSSFMQGVEGEIDSSHISWLHKDFDQSKSALPFTGAALGNAAPIIELKDTFYGFTYGARRDLGEDYYWRVTQWITPMFSLIPIAPGEFIGGGGRAWVPIDDNNCTVFSFGFRVDRPYTDEERFKQFDSGAVFPPKLTRGTYKLADGYTIDTFLPEATQENDYGLDRARQRDVNYSGIWGIHDQDRALAENSKPMDRDNPGIVDRSLEHLVGSDRAIVTARRRLIDMALKLQQGIEPQIARRPEAFGVRAISKISRHKKFAELLGEFGSEARLPVDSFTADGR
jgi:phthalate 4,5-dioxygenase oxygenase subunit